MFSLCFFPSLSLAGARAIYHSKHVWHFNNALNMKRGRNKNGFVFCTDEQPDRDRDEAVSMCVSADEKRDDHPQTEFDACLLVNDVCRIYPV